MGRLVLVDLAGSEPLKKSLSTGARLRLRAVQGADSPLLHVLL